MYLHNYTIYAIMKYVYDIVCVKHIIIREYKLMKKLRYRKDLLSTYEMNVRDRVNLYIARG